MCPCEAAGGSGADRGHQRRELITAGRMARHGAMRLLGRADAGNLATAIADHRACWLERSRPGGLADSVAHLEPQQPEAR